MVQLQDHAAQLDELGFQIVGISPDAPRELQRTRNKHGLSYRLLADRDLTATRKFGIGFGAPGKRPLPVPAVFIVAADGTIRFQYVNPNYRVRLDMEVLVATAKAALKE